ncbi:MAG: TlpA family protein disulfide reductase [Dysgonamonadaceae bacterium]|nr:TlpA family protein disulfide reductase [Dysgonamonadaceae bacterium]
MPHFQWRFHTIEDFRQLYDSFSSRLKRTPLGKRLDIEIKKVENTIIGAIAPDFFSNDLEGRLIKLSDFRGSYVFLDFWATWCPPCMASFPYIEKLYEKYAPQGLRFIAVSCDFREERWRSGAKKLGSDWYNIAFVNNYQKYHQGVLDSNDIEYKYPCQGIPKFFIIDPSGIVIGRWDGYSSSIEIGINELLEKVFSSENKY